MFDVKGVDIKIEIPVPEDFNTIKDRCNLIFWMECACSHAEAMRLWQTHLYE